MKLLVQSDDYGFTKAVTYGIIEGIDNGILTCTGMFTNMEIAPWAAEFIKARPDFCFGIDFNLVAGPSVSPKEDIPHLVDENGRFIRSSVRIRDPRWSTKEGQEELLPYDEVYKETRAQFDRFVELTGRKPGYLQGHSIITDSIIKVIKQVSKEENVPFAMDYFEKAFTTFQLPDDEEVQDNVSVNKVFNAETQLKKNPLRKFLKNKDEILKHEFVISCGHCGYVDAELMSLTSLSLERMRDLELVVSEEMKQFVKDNNVQLVNYYDLVKEGI